MTTRYIALLDGREGAYGVTFPDAPGCTAMGRSRDEALRNAAVALADWIDHEGAPVARTKEALRADLDVAEQLADGAELMVVTAPI